MRLRSALLICGLFFGCAAVPRSSEPRTAATPPVPFDGDGCGMATAPDAGAEVADATPGDDANATETTIAASPDDAAATPTTRDAGPPKTRGAGGCMRQRKTFQYRCSGMAPRPGEPNSYPVTACDRCLTDADCTDKPGGRCTHVGGPACTGPSRLECRYPSAKCGGKICSEPAPPMPPSMPRR